MNVTCVKPKNCKILTMYLTIANRAYMFPEEILLVEMVKYYDNEWQEMMVFTMFDLSIQSLSFIVKLCKSFHECLHLEIQFLHPFNVDMGQNEP